jgi:hypothetical protein
MKETRFVEAKAKSEQLERERIAAEANRGLRDELNCTT